MNLTPEEKQEITEALSIAAGSMQSLRKQQTRKGNFVLVRHYTDKQEAYSKLRDKIIGEYGEEIDAAMMGQLDEVWEKVEAS